MGRNPALLLRQLIANRSKLCCSAYRLPYLPSNSPQFSNSIATSSSPITFTSFPLSKTSHFSSLPSPPCRFLSTSSDESVPAIFYFTAVWCGPCRLISPIIGQLSEQYPHVTTYKIDIDEKDLGKTLSELNITSVPTFQFFQNGKKAAEVIGADAQLLKSTMEKLYE
ncbi:thioredoxin O2, mitochondrial isoform X2 [Cannabis sativa]|uniref:thioredoxin O2, mitochondrial isoform X2 n=1 Tax=Cannabis sativa TaxID=3483 RepID=UPI0029CA1BB5|nr:thioredoxin O2, mitochondrial isoform X2 [Cannabis sativa]